MITPVFGRPTILFDLDGTLIDSAPDIALAINKSLVKNYLSPVDETVVRALIGNGSKSLVHGILSRKLSSTGSIISSKIHEDFIEAYKQSFFFYSKLYPQVTSTLSKVSKYFNLVCLTNKPYEIAQPILSHTKLARYFQFTIAGNTLSEKKPSPLGIFFCARKLKCKTQNMLLVGDSEIDIQTAKSAGIPAIAANYGYTGNKDLFDEGAAATVDYFGEIPTLLRKFFDKNKLAKAG